MENKICWLIVNVKPMPIMHRDGVESKKVVKNHENYV
jgi:hypothetical protein